MNAAAGDASVSLLAPGPLGCGLTANETVSIEFENNAVVSIPEAYLYLEVDGVFVSSDTLVGVVAGGATSTFTFPVTADLSASGPHTIRVAATAPADGDNSNDTVEFQVTNFAVQALPIPVVTFTG